MCTIQMAQENAHRVFEELVAGFLAGELNEADKLRFEQVLEEVPELQGRLEEFRKIWEGVDAVAEQESYDLDAEWTAFEKRLPGRATMDPDTTSRDKGRSLFLHPVLRVAAILVIGLLIGLGGLLGVRVSSTTTVVAKAETVEIPMLDGSLIILNRDSKIRYSRKDKGEERRVRLEGEAWFDVARDSLRPFVIDAGSAVVEVLGTSFNVNAYRENPTVEITVESGMVALSARADGSEQIVLHAGNSGSYDPAQQQLELEPIANPNNIAWKTRELYFDNSTLEEVARILSAVYHVEVEILNPAIRSCPITVSFSQQSLESVLTVLESTLDLEIRQEGSRILMDGDAC